jgi:hypothetical protein
MIIKIGKYKHKELSEMMVVKNVFTYGFQYDYYVGDCLISTRYCHHDKFDVSHAKDNYIYIPPLRFIMKRPKAI